MLRVCVNLAYNNVVLIPFHEEDKVKEKYTTHFNFLLSENTTRHFLNTERIGLQY